MVATHAGYRSSAGSCDDLHDPYVAVAVVTRLARVQMDMDRVGQVSWACVVDAMNHANKSSPGAAALHGPSDSAGCMRDSLGLLVVHEDAVAGAGKVEDSEGSAAHHVQHMSLAVGAARAPALDGAGPGKDAEAVLGVAVAAGSWVARSRAAAGGGLWACAKVEEGEERKAVSCCP